MNRCLHSYHVPLGIAMIAALVFSLHHRQPSDPAPSTAPDAAAQDPHTGESPSVSADKPSPHEYVPGGVPVPAVADPALDAENLFAPATGASWANGDTLPAKTIHHRIRGLNLNAAIDLRPPAVGQEHEAARRFAFDLFDDVKFSGRVTRIERHGPERVVYFGQLDDISGDFILAYNEGAAVATFSTPTLGQFQIRYLGRGRHAAIEINSAALPPCQSQHTHAGNATPRPGSNINMRARNALMQMLAGDSVPSPVEGSVYSGVGQQGGSGAGLSFTEVDVMVVHTAAATAAAGDTIGMQALMDVALARANSAFINSDVGIRLRLVSTREVAYTEGNLDDDLHNLREGNGALADVSAWRDASGADLVSLFTTASGGRAYLYNGSDDLGFSVVGIGNTESTFIHEIGHNFGLRHDRENDSTLNPIYSYSHGWRFTPENAPQLRTIMAYAPGRSIPYFSNPEVHYMDTPTGVAIGEPLESNNAEALRQTKAAVANFRGAAGNLPPVVSLESPHFSASFFALDEVSLAATASDPDGSVSEVRYYRLRSDDQFGFSNYVSVPLGSDASAPFAATETQVPAGFWTYAAVAVDDAGGYGVDTISITVAPHYGRSDHPLPDGKLRAEIEAINENGRFVGYGHNGDPGATNVRAAYWENGEVFLLNPLPGDTGARALAVDASGVIYGASISSGGDLRAVRWDQDPNPSDISGIIPGFNAYRALGVDEFGRIYLADDSDYHRFDNPGSTTADLNQHWVTVASTGSYVAGHDYNGTDAFWAMRWNNSGTLLPPLDGYASSWGRATNRSGSVIGFSGPLPSAYSSQDVRLTFWPAGSAAPVDLGILGAEGGWAYDLNDFDHGVGFANTAQDGTAAFIWKGGGDLLDINRLILPGAGTLTSARVINNRGQIAGTGFVDSDQVIFFLDPLPGLDHRYWLADYFAPDELDNPALTDDSANPSGDGLPNLLKRALGLNPRIPFQVGSGNANPLPQASVGEDDHLYLTIRRLRNPGDLSYFPEATHSLTEGGWDTALLEIHSITFLDNDFEEVVLRSTSPISEHDKMFARLRVTH